MKGDGEAFRVFEGFDRFGYPQGIVRVTAGHGGESLLILGSEKAALLDCGMAYCAGGLVENIKRALGERDLDYILLSHTHYDHIGALPQIKRKWPYAVVYGAGHAAKVLSKPGAVNAILALGENARILYGGKEAITAPVGGFAVDSVIGDRDVISLGREELTVLETKGHTDCSLSFALEPHGMLFLSESTGCLEGPENIHVSILKSYSDAMKSLAKCRRHGARTLMSPHYGLVPDYYTDRYWELFEETAESYREFLFDLFARGLSDDEVMESYEARYWDDLRRSEQPKEAFMLNAVNIVKVFRREHEQARA